MAKLKGYVLEQGDISCLVKHQVQSCECVDFTCTDDVDAFGGSAALGTTLIPLLFLQLQNSSVVAVGFRVLLASLSSTRPRGGVDRVDVLLGNYTDPKLHPTVGKMPLTLHHTSSPGTLKNSRAPNGKAHVH